MKSRSIVVLLALVGPGCGKDGTGAPARTPDAAAPGLRDAGQVAVDAAADAPAPDAPAGDPGLRSPAEVAYQQFIDAFNDGYRRRLVSCFHFNATTLGKSTYREFEPGFQVSLRLGFASWNAAEAARCLHEVNTASCLDIVSEKALVACNRVFTGKIPADGICLNDVDCAEPGHVCRNGAVASCGGICLRDLARTAPAGEGGTCLHTPDCQPGLYCAPMIGLSEGTCRPVAAGISCNTRDVCPWPWTCVSSGPSGPGACGPGKALGQPCRGWGDPSRPEVDSDCAFTLRCGMRGLCEAESPFPPPEPPPEIAPGGACVLEGDVRCVVGTFCRFDPADLMREPPPPRVSGVCLLWRKPGDSCEQPEACQPGSTCLRGTCVSCLSGAGADGGTPADVSPGSDGGCGAKVLTDPNNCGACGRSCQGTGCVDGLCQPRAVGTGVDSEVEGMVIDDSGIYLTELLPSGRVLRVTTDGSRPLLVLASNQNLPRAVAIDATHVYWVNGSGGTIGAVSRVPKAGGAVHVLAGEEVGPQYLAVDDTHVYWANNSEGAKEGVRRVAKTGGAVEMVSAGGGPSGIALDATHVYWSEWGGEMVRRRPKNGGPSQLLATGQKSARLVVLDGQRVYWSTEDQISSVLKDGGPVTILAPAFNTLDLATDGSGGVWWSTGNDINRWPAPPTKLVDSIGLHEIEIRGPWLYYQVQGSVFRIAR